MKKSIEKLQNKAVKNTTTVKGGNNGVTYTIFMEGSKPVRA